MSYYIYLIFVAHKKIMHFLFSSISQTLFYLGPSPFKTQNSSNWSSFLNGVSFLIDVTNKVPHHSLIYIKLISLCWPNPR